MIALVFPFQTELEAFLAGLIVDDGKAPVAGMPSSGQSTQALPKPLRHPSVQEERIGTLRTYTLAARPDWRFAVCGQGKVEAALACQILAHALQPSAFVLLGSACALDDSLKAGDTVLADPCIEYDFQHGPPPSGAHVVPGPDHHPVFRSQHPLPGLGLAGMPPVRTGAVLSADRNVFEPEAKRALQSAHGALAAAWEGAGFHRFLRRNGAKGWELRLITEESCEGRPTLEALRGRMQKGFPALYPLVEALAKG